MSKPNQDLSRQKQTNNLPPKAKNHLGKTFGFLTVTSYVGKDKHGSLCGLVLVVAARNYHPCK